MAAHPFLTTAAKQAVQRAVVDIESRTAAEIIVNVRRTSGRYREADYLAGFLAGLAERASRLFGDDETDTRSALAAAIARRWRGWKGRNGD